MHKGLHNGVIGSIHVERERALPIAVEGRVPIRRYDPILPPKIFKADKQVSLLAAVPTSRWSCVKVWVLFMTVGVADVSTMALAGGSRNTVATTTRASVTQEGHHKWLQVAAAT